MTKILTNMPLQCFDARENFADIEFLSYGPEHRMWVDGRHYAPDIRFDPSTGSIDELFAKLPRNFYPDLILFYWPDQDPLPKGFEHCPVTSIGLISDYNLSLPYISGLWPFFDILICDHSAVDLFRNISYPDVRAFCQFSFKASSHRIHPGIDRDLDVAFAGNLNPMVQQQRQPWIDRLRELPKQGISCELRDDIFGVDYGRFLNRARIGFNHSIRSEMNLRAFEVPACGALLFMESSNQEVREFLEPGEEVVLYDEDNFTDLLREYLTDHQRRNAIARAGHERIQQYNMGRRIPALLHLLAEPGPGRPPASPFDLALGRGTAMLGTWSAGATAHPDLLMANRLAPEDPRPLNALALSVLRTDLPDRVQQAAKLFARAAELAPSYLPAVTNLAHLFERAERPAEQQRCRQELQRRLANISDWRDVDGPLLPLGCSERSILLAQTMVAAIRSGKPQALAPAFADAGHAAAATKSPRSGGLQTGQPH